MGFVNTIGKYQLGRTIGEGTFAKVKLAVDSTNGHNVAIKIIDKHMVMESNLKFQVQREIRTMKLLHHPNIVRIHEVIGTKTKIYIVMDYVSGGQLSDKMSCAKKLDESEARKLFQQLIDAVDYCHNRGVYHRDLKPDNLLLDSKGNIKVSDFGLSALRKHGDMLTTACGSPCYVAPELLANKGYDGAVADVWSCGVILFEMLAGYLPFDERNLVVLYKKIAAADYKCPSWFTESQKTLISRILEPSPKKRITIPEIIEDLWFQIDYLPSLGNMCGERIHLDDVNAAFESIEENTREPTMNKSQSFINAFQLIAMSNDLDLSGLFEEQNDNEKTRLGSKLTVGETLMKIEAAAKDVSYSVERMNNCMVKIHPTQIQMMSRNTRSYYDLSAEVIEVTPTNCVVEISKSVGELKVYKEFCNSLSNLLTETPVVISLNQEQKVESKHLDGNESSEEKENRENKGTVIFQLCSSDSEEN
jgi:serine/threonine protein kinase